MTLSDHLAALGIKLPDLIAGMSGGLVKALVFHKDQPGEAVISTVIGAFTANYMGEWVATQLLSMGVGRGAACFVTGIVAMILVQLAIDQAKKWTPKSAKADAGDGTSGGNNG